MPRVSILLTSYNHEAFIKESIQSILDQDFKDFELYIIDDASTDESWDIISQFRDKRIIAMQNEVNQGSALTKQLVQKFKGEFFAVAHSDDCWRIDKLGKQVKYLDMHQEVGACFSDALIIDEEGKEFNDLNHRYTGVFLSENMNRFEWLNHFFYHGNRLCHPSILMRTEIQMKEDLFAPALGSLPDLFRWIKLCLQHEIYVYPEKLTLFRVHRDNKNVSGDNSENICRYHNDLFMILKLYSTIDVKKVFLNIFPEATQYVYNGDISLPFALSMIMLNRTNFEEYHLFALESIYNLFNSVEGKSKILKYYNFAEKDYKRLSGENDIFSKFSMDKYITISLYYCRSNESFTLDKKISIDNFMINGKIEICIDLQDLNHLGITQLRIDPGEGFFRAYKNLNIEINGHCMEYSISDMHKKIDDWIFICTPDPKFIVKGLPKTLTNFCLSADVKTVDMATVAEILESVHHTQDNEIKELQRKLNKTHYRFLK